MLDQEVKAKGFYVLLNKEAVGTLLLSLDVEGKTLNTLNAY